jgi:hypothetical protein
MRRNWLERHPRWKIAAGLLLLTLFGTGVLLLVELAFQHSEVSRQAEAIAGTNPQVRQLLGEPIAVGEIILGNIHINGSVGHAELTIPISGPRGEGVIHAVANRRDEGWRFAVLQVDVEGKSESIDLLTGEPAGRIF